MTALTRVRALAILLALLAATLAQAVPSVLRKSATYDELLYIAAGASYWRTGDFRMNPEHPPLAKLLAGAAVAAGDAGRALPLDHPSWAAMAGGGAAGADAQWQFTEELVRRLGRRTEATVSWARLPSLAGLLLLVVGAYAGAARLWGRAAGLVAATLCAFCPNLLAFGSLVSNDFWAAVTVLSAVLAFLRWLERPGAGRLAAAGATAGLALAAKYTSLVLLPLYVVAIALLPWRVAGRGVWPICGALAGLAASAAAVLALCHGSLLGPLTYVRNVHELWGKVDPGYAFYLAGEFRTGGFPQYFAVAFLVKTPLGVLGLLALRLALDPRHRVPHRRELAVVATVLVAWFAFTSASAHAMGLRYLLPVYPLLAVTLASIVATPAFGRAWVRAAVGTLLAAAALESLLSHPNYLPFCNAAAGGPRNTIAWLDDSNLDWGQDLILVREYAREHDLRGIELLVVCSYDPVAAYGVPGRPGDPAHLLRAQPLRGVYAASIHVLNRLRRPDFDPFTRLVPVAELGGSILVYRH